MRETGEVIKAEGGTVTLKMKRTSACGQCRACAVGNAPDELRVTVKNECGAKENDLVRVDLKPEVFYKAALIMYGLPLTGLLAGFWLGDMLGAGLGFGEYTPLMGAVCGAAALFIVLLCIKKREPKWKAKGYAPVAAEIVKKA
ncbi:MAG: SoxR reducing system RseC family protein [Clostridiales bacterium]|jgi:sigma-E factor negative regulatory protein RseC|nr:SoxR reducing system RseC family protein [Clostridiales bacterium]